MHSYDATVFHRRSTCRAIEGLPPAYIWPPAIDPLAPKNMALSPEDAAYIVDQFGIDVDRPAADPGVPLRPLEGPARRDRRVAEPCGRATRDVQLALVGSMAHDDPEGWDFYNQTVASAGGDPDIFILSNLNNVGSVEVNAFQVHSAALIQKSIREGFGLTVTEALWKARPIVAGRAGGIVDQIQDGETGFLVDFRRGVRARRCSRSSTIRRKRAQMALRGKEYVRRRFLMPRLLRDWLALFNRLTATIAGGAELVDRSATRLAPSPPGTVSAMARPAQADRRLEPRAGDVRT